MGKALTADPSLELEAYLGQHFARVEQPFVVVMNDGRIIPVATLSRLFPRTKATHLAATPTCSVAAALRRIGKIKVAGQTTGVVLPSPGSRMRRLAWTSGAIGAVLVWEAPLWLGWSCSSQFDAGSETLNEPRAGWDKARVRARTRARKGLVGRLGTYEFDRMAADLETRADQIVPARR